MRTIALFVFLLALASAKTFKVFQLTDIHIEEKYTVGAPADCTAPPCCRPDSVAKSETSRVAGKWGDHSCDSAPIFINETMLWFKNYFEQNPSQKPDFIMVTGDEAIHGSKTRQSQEINIHAAQTVFSMVRQHFRDYVIVPTFGNHDTYPEGHMMNYPNNTWMTYPMAEFWDEWVPKEQIDNVKKGGYYTKLVDDKFRVIVLNCLWEYTTNKEVEDIPDPADQYAFLEDTLALAAQNGEKVWIVTHIPSGSSVLNKYNIIYSNLISKYRDIVMASFSGHTHVDEFYVTRDINSPYRTPLHVNFVTAALEGYGGNNPGVKLYTYDDETKKIVDFVTYIGDLDKINKDDKMNWEPYFTAREAMGVKDMEPATIVDWANKMFDDDELFQDYMTRYHVGLYKRGDCKDSCKVNAICSILYTEISDKKKCIQSRGNYEVLPDKALYN